MCEFWFATLYMVILKYMTSFDSPSLVWMRKYKFSIKHISKGRSKQCCHRKKKLERVGIFADSEKGNKRKLTLVTWDSNISSRPWDAPQINLSLTQGANHNYKASLCPIHLWPQGQSQQYTRGKVIPLDSLEMDVLFLSNMLGLGGLDRLCERGLNVDWT